jgi:ribosome-binding protein aMBF1 (putative translation factor)
VTVTPTERLSTELARHFGRLVAEERTKRGWSQSFLATATRSTQQTISSIEAGDLIPRDHLKVRIAFAFGMQPSDLFVWPEAKVLRQAVAS